MKKTLLYGLGVLSIIATVLYLPNGVLVNNSPQNQVGKLMDLSAIEIPVALTTPNYQGSTYSVQQEVEIMGIKGIVYGEIDNNENFYYLGYTKSLSTIFSAIPNAMLFEEYIAVDTKLATKDGGSYSDCMGTCDSTLREGGSADGDKLAGYGRCRFRCWVDVVF